ncbi:ubiquitin elongating factor core-domain-containing protein [Rhypophila decipiens]|uniref:Ubiquitin elongating factor core-domain-containing protein n=1 Tax=Rhypophila decipiens TaxID=261697 RepID=A0AAN6YAD8_9PEZI|nr:ubiquitin elongating factor core-domain-containing protein [Rhypophila decipiens]
MDPSEEQQTPAPPAPAPAPEAPDKETMEAIRRRRLERLGGGGGSGSPAGGASTTDSSIGRPAISNKPPTPTASPSAVPPQEEARPPISITPLPKQTSSPSPAGSVAHNKRKASASEPDNNRTTASSATPPPLRKQANTPKPDESIEDYADRVLGTLFRITLDRNKTTDLNGHRLTYLEGLAAELESDGLPLKFSVDRLEEAIMEAAREVPHSKPLFGYLLPCWKRTARAIKSFRGGSALAAEKEQILKEARRLCFSNCIFALTIPDLFGRESNHHEDSLVPYLLKDVEHDSGLCMDFFSEAVSRLDEDDSIADLFTRAMVDISSKLSSLTMNDDYKAYVNALLTYTRFPRLLNALAQDPTFQMAQSAPGIEKNTLLGPFFRISPLQPEVTQVYFAGPRTMDKGRIQTSQNALQMTLTAHQSDLQTIINAFIRASPQSRNKVLDWFAFIVNANHKRRALQVDPREVSSDGFMVNVTVVLDYLCQPFMDSTFSKVERIDVNYFRRKPRVDIKDETKLNADQNQSDKFYATAVDGESNFITEIFFLTLAAHHYGSEAANAKMKQLDKDIKYYEKHLALMEAERPRLINRPDQLRLLETTLKRHIAVLEKSISLKYAIEGVLLEEKMQGRSLQFMRYVTVWLLRVASKDTKYAPDKQLKLPLPEQSPDEFSCLPEYALQDIVDNFKFIYRFIPRVMLSAVGEELVTLCVTFLESSQYIKNPYLKSALVTLLFSGTWPIYHLQKGVLGDLLTNTKFANDHLLHAIMKFYIECESTGAHTQFYDKFNIRYEIFQVIKCVWSNDHYKRQLTQSSKSNRQFFIRFVNLLLNDATYVLDEALSKFPKIHELQEKLRVGMQELSQEDRDRIAEELKTTESQATSYMQLVNETVSMMNLFTSTLGEAFTMPEIVTRLAGMLDYNLEILTGPKSRTLKVDNPDKYQFNPRTLLPQIVTLYVNLGFSQTFVEAVAGDGRSYKPELMNNVTEILEKKAMKVGPELEAWKKLTKRFEEAKKELDSLEMDFGDDIPAEFEDPIMGHLMKDPVKLPSRTIVDRSTIVQHLLSDMKDPFNRQPMTLEDLVPVDELRIRIEEWVEEKRREGRATREAAAAADAGDPMDTKE